MKLLYCPKSTLRQIFGIIFFVVPIIAISQTNPFPPKADPLTVEVVRKFGGELFLMNSTAFLEPLVRRMNAATNSRTFHSAAVGKGFSIRFGLHGMAAFVNESDKIYKPVLPRDSLNLLTLGNYVQIVDIVKQQFIIKDSAGLIAYAAKVLIDEGIKSGQIQVPGVAPTFFGNISQSFVIPKDYLRQRISNPVAGDLLSLLSPAVRQAIIPAIERLPPEFPLPTGQNLGVLSLGVPQVEIGSLWGTELLLRFIPNIDWGKNIGRFGFWGVGLRHSISTYLPESPVELAAQVVVQGTSLRNTVGVTGAELKADATIFTANVHASKRVGIVDFFTGLSYDNMGITASYTFTLPRQLQAELGLIRPIDLNNDGAISDDEFVPDPANGYPGDTQPQTQTIPLQANSLRWTLGASLSLGPVRLIADYNLSSFSMLTFGIDVRF